MKAFLLASAFSLGILWTSSALDSPIYTAAKGQLVSSNGTSVSHFDDSALEPVKYYGIYYSASWCGPCRAFTPKLVEWYNQNKAANPHFELIFVSSDNSAPEMSKYMKDDKMKWPALEFQRIKSNHTLRQYAGGGIPDLVFMDDQGKVISDSYVKGTYVGPYKVLEDIEKTLHANKPSAEALAAKKPTGDSFDDFFKKKPPGQ